VSRALSQDELGAGRLVEAALDIITLPAMYTTDAIEIAIKTIERASGEPDEEALRDAIVAWLREALK